MTIACTSCHARKVRCMIEDGASSCAACQTIGEECIPRVRKRRRFQSKPESHESHTEARLSWPANDGAHREVLNRAPIRMLQGTSNQMLLRNDEGAQQDIARDNSSISSAGRQTNRSTVIAYVGRDHYIFQEDAVDESNIATPATEAVDPDASQSNHQTRIAVVKLWNGFTVPPRAIRHSLLESFLDHCHTWTPVLEADDLTDLSNAATTPASMLLAQSVWMAGSRFSSSPSVAAFATTSQFYDRARALFWSTTEDNATDALKASIILQWYNPLGPEKTSFDNSEFWLKIGVGLAHQLGLHREPKAGTRKPISRRLWWTLVARDSLISFAHGRPRAIHSEDCDVLPLIRTDFSETDPDRDFLFFSSWVAVCELLGSVTECCMRRDLSTRKRDSMEQALCDWARSLPPEIRLESLLTNQSRLLAHPQGFRARQLHLPYLTSLIILCRSPKRAGTASLPAVIAASLSARIFEDFLARDEIRFLAPVHTRFCLISCMALVALMPDAQRWAEAQPDLQALQLTLTELSKMWGSAVGASKMLASIIEQRRRMPIVPAPNEALNLGEIQTLFEDVDLTHCRMWECLNNADLYSTETDPALFRTMSDGEDMIFQPKQSLEDQTNLGLDLMEFGEIDDWILDDRFML